MKLFVVILLMLVGTYTIETTNTETKSHGELAEDLLRDLGTDQKCAAQLCEHRETELMSSLLTILKIHGDTNALLKSCQDHEKQLISQLTNFEGTKAKLVSALESNKEAENKINLLEKQLKDSRANESIMYNSYVACLDKVNQLEDDKKASQEHTKKCEEYMGRVVAEQEKISNILGENMNALRRGVAPPKASLNTVQLSTGIYLFHNKMMNWSTAREFCKSNGMDLVAIETAAENQAIYEHARNLPGWHDAWTSGCFSSAQGNHVWKSTGATAGYFNWAGGEPSDRRDGFCILVTNHSPLWWDAGDDAAIRAVCEL